MTPTQKRRLIDEMDKTKNLMQLYLDSQERRVNRLKFYFLVLLPFAVIAKICVSIYLSQ